MLHSLNVKSMFHSFIICILKIALTFKMKEKINKNHTFETALRGDLAVSKHFPTDHGETTPVRFPSSGDA